MLKNHKKAKLREYERLEKERQMRVESIIKYVSSTPYGYVNNSAISFKSHIKLAGEL